MLETTQVLKKLLQNLRAEEQAIAKQIKMLEITLTVVEDPNAVPLPAEAVAVAEPSSMRRQTTKRGQYEHCTTPGCTERHTAKGFCSRHYAEYYREKLKAERNGVNSVVLSVVKATE